MANSHIIKEYFYRAWVLVAHKRIGIAGLFGYGRDREHVVRGFYSGACLCARGRDLIPGSIDKIIFLVKKENSHKGFGCAFIIGVPTVVVATRHGARVAVHAVVKFYFIARAAWAHVEGGRERGDEGGCVRRVVVQVHVLGKCRDGDLVPWHHGHAAGNSGAAAVVKFLNVGAGRARIGMVHQVEGYPVVVQEIRISAALEGCRDRGAALDFRGERDPYIAEVVFQVILVFPSCPIGQHTAFGGVDELQHIVFVDKLANVIGSLGCVAKNLLA